LEVDGVGVGEDGEKEEALEFKWGKVRAT